MTRLIVTIDGPAASGKSTVARLLAKKLGVTFLDTGAMYRAAALAAMRAGIDLTDERKLISVLDAANFEFEPAHEGMLVRLAGVDITDQIREPLVTANARYVAGSPQARQRLIRMQRQFAEVNNRLVTEGRDQGTVAFPDADLKFFLDADLDERTRRRLAELNAKGVKQTAEQVRRDIYRRDESDENRAVGPLKPASDAVVVDTTELNAEEVVEKLIALVREKCAEKL